MARGGVIFNPDVQSDIDMKNTYKLLNYPGSGNAILSIANTIYVDGTNGTSGGVRGTSNAFQTLAQAMAVAQNGDNIVVRPGTYTMSVGIVVDKSVTIIGNGAKLLAPSEDIVGFFGITAANVTIDGFEIDGGRTSSVVPSNNGHISVQASHATIKNCYIHDGVGIGIRAIQFQGGSSDNLTVINNRLETLANGIVVQAATTSVSFPIGQQHIRITGNTIKDGIGADTWNGIFVSTSDGVNVIDDIEISSNTIIGPSTGTNTSCIQAWHDHTRLRIFGNHTYGAVFGISVSACHNGIVSANEVSRFGTYGLEVGSDNIAVVGNTFDGRGAPIVVTDGVITGTTNLQSTATTFATDVVGKRIVGANIADNDTTISVRVDAHNLTLSKASTNGTGLTVTLEGSPSTAQGISISNSGGGPTNTDIPIIGNTIYGCGNSLAIQGCDRVNVIGNTIDKNNTSYSAINFADVSHSKIIGNTINIGTNGTAPINLDSTNAAITTVDIKDNTIVGTTANSIIHLYANVHNIGNLNIEGNYAVDAATPGAASGLIDRNPNGGGAIGTLHISGNIPDRTTLANNQFGWDNDIPSWLGNNLIANTSALLKGNGTSQNAIAATAKTDYWDTTVFVASGASHAKGLVPDPGVSAGTTKFLREDATWDVPPSGTSATIAVTSANLKGDGAGNAIAVTATGTGDTVLATSPTLVTPTIGVATATSVNKWTLTAPATGITIAGTDNASYVLPPLPFVGYMDIPTASHSADYTLTLADCGKCQLHPASDANNRTFTVDSHTNVTWRDGATHMIENMSANNLSIAITTDTMYLAGSGTTGTRTLAQYGRALLRYTLATNSWMISGVGVS